MKSIKLVRYPFEYFLAQIYFAKKIQETTGKWFDKVVEEYTDLYGALTLHTMGNDTDRAWVMDIVRSFEKMMYEIKDPVMLATKAYELFLSNEYVSITEIKEVKPLKSNLFGCFKYNYSPMYKSNNQIRTHFIPSRVGLFQKSPELKTSDLAPIYMSQRRTEFSMLINYIYNNRDLFDSAKYLTSSSWLQSVPAYQSFFPEKYSQNAELRKRLTHGYHWIWGQFLKWDLSGNKKRLQKFKEDLDNAKTFEEVINCIPCPIYEIKVPLEEMFEMYVTQDALINKESLDTKF